MYSRANTDTFTKVVVGCFCYQILFCGFSGQQLQEEAGGGNLWVKLMAPCQLVLKNNFKARMKAKIHSRSQSLASPHTHATADINPNQGTPTHIHTSRLHFHTHRVPKRHNVALCASYSSSASLYFLSLRAVSDMEGERKDKKIREKQTKPISPVRSSVKMRGINLSRSRM